jgi:hypothetical protein
MSVSQMTMDMFYLLLSNPALSSFMTCNQIFNMSNTSIGAGTAYHSGAHEFTLVHH